MKGQTSLNWEPCQAEPHNENGPDFSGALFHYKNLLNYLDMEPSFVNLQNWNGNNKIFHLIHVITAQLIELQAKQDNNV